MIIKPIRSTDGTGTLTYIVVDEQTASAAIIDPNIEDIERILSEVKSLSATISTIIDTHTHADHVSAAAELKRLTSAEVIMHSAAKEKYKFVDLGDAFGIGDILRENVKVRVDRFVNDRDTIALGNSQMSVIFSPGHTDDHICLLAEGHLFTGDVLLIGQAGRSDLPGGSAEEQYDTLFNKILNLPLETVIHPGHDYEGNDASTLADEKKNNPFLAPRSKAEYIGFVKEFFPPMADTEDGKVVLQCGTKRIVDDHEGFVNIDSIELKKMMSSGSELVLLDVRQPMELLAFGAIEGVVNVPVSEVIYGKKNLGSIKDKSIVVICQSGGRSIEAAHYLSTHGFKKVYNLVGGTLDWMRSGFPVKRSFRKGALA